MIVIVMSGRRYKWRPLRTLLSLGLIVALVTGAAMAIGSRLSTEGVLPAVKEAVPATESLEVSFPLKALLLLSVTKEPVEEEVHNVGAVPFTEEDLLLLARLIHGEARGESFEGQLAVGSVVMNRMVHPNRRLYGGPTMKGVIYKDNAFCAVREAAWSQQPTDSSLNAARQVLEGHRSFGADVVYFFNAATASNSSFMASVEEVAQIGRHTFAKP